MLSFSLKSNSRKYLLITAITTLLISKVCFATLNHILRPGDIENSIENKLFVNSDLGTLYWWADYLNQYNAKKKEQIIMAVFGKPTYPLDPSIKMGFLEYWQNINDQKAIPYGDVKGEDQYRAHMASAINNLYSVSKTNYSANNVVFTFGGIGALHGSFYAIKKLQPKGKIVVIYPYYPVYIGNIGYNKQINDLHFVDVIKDNSYSLNENNLLESLKKLKTPPAAFIFCDPNNPLGTRPSKIEWKKIAKILKRYPNVPIILDEAYSEMTFDINSYSLLEVAPELDSQIVVLRSATKGMSAAGERMAIAFSKNEEFINLIAEYNLIQNIHVPKSLQHAYTKAMSEFSKEKQIKLSDFYKSKVIFVNKELKKLGVSLNYLPQATFYIIVDLSKLKGKKINPLAKKVLLKSNNTIDNDIDIAYHLIFQHNLAIAPLSYFGLPSDKCWLRITCADDIKILQEIVNKIALSLQES